MALGFVQSILLVCLILFPILWLTSNTFRYYAKFIFYNVTVVLISGFFVIPYAIFRPGNVQNLRPLAWIWTKMFSLYGMDVQVRNEHNLVSDKPYVLVSNHQSSLDLIGMMKIFPDRCTAMAKKELMYAGTFGFAAVLCGIVFVDRVNKTKAHGTMNKTAQLILDKNVKLWVFPEGTRNHDGNMLPFKKGAFHLAMQAQVPVVPVVFSTYRNFLSKKKKIFNRGKIIIECLPPVPTQGIEYTPENVTDLTEKVFKQMVAVYKRINVEVLPYVEEIAEQDDNQEKAPTDGASNNTHVATPPGGDSNCCEHTMTELTHNVNKLAAEQ